MNQSIFYKQADLLLQVLPEIAKYKQFALKGGTAINFFHQDLPRLSVDIDLAYVPLGNRDAALQDISQALIKISQAIQRQIPDIRITQKRIQNTEYFCALIVNRNGITVKIETNHVTRGTVYPAETKELSDAVYTTFQRFVAVQTLSFSDLYGGKLCAALDRQHPRDFYDIKLLLDKTGMTPAIHKAFLVYLISHPRPIVELLNPNFREIKTTFENEFEGMTRERVSLSELEHTQNKLPELISKKLSNSDRTFLLLFKKREPQWELLGVSGAKELPAVKWKLENLAKMKTKKHKRAVDKLAEYLEI